MQTTSTLVPEAKRAATAARPKKAVRDWVLARLGQPPALWRLDVRFCQYGCHCRVNVWQQCSDKTAAMASVQLTDSFYLHLTDNKVTTCDPPIYLRYEAITEVSDGQPM